MLLTSASFAFELKVWSETDTVPVSKSVGFKCTPSGGEGPYKYSWNFDDVDTYKNGFSTAQSPSHVFNHLGIHHVCVKVTDSSGVEEEGVIPIRVVQSLSTPEVNVTEDCGRYNLDRTGKSDVGSDLKNCIDANYDSRHGIRLYFPKGTYRFDDVDSGGYRIGFALNWGKIEFYGDGPDRTTLSFYNNSTDTTKTHGDFFRAGNSISTANWAWRKMTLKLDLSARGNSHDDFSRRQFLISNVDDNSKERKLMLEECNIEDFTSIVYWGAFLTIKRSNIIGFGRGKDKDSDSKPFEAAVDYGDNSLIRWNYWADGARGEKTPLGHSHIFYPQNVQYTYVIENYADSSNSAKDKITAQLKKRILDSEFSGNLCVNTYSGEGVQWGHNDYISERLVINDNRFQNIDEAAIKFINTLTAEAKRNFFSNSGKPTIICENGSGDCDNDNKCRSNNIIIEDNEYGYKMSFASFGRSTDNCSITNIIEDGGLNTSNKYKSTDPSGWYNANGYIDPGEFEFDPPINVSVSIVGEGQKVQLSLSATDQVSGMGASARFPFHQGGLMQFSNDGKTWSEIRPYSQTSSWTLSNNNTVYARFRDRDGNWSDVVSTDGTDFSSPQPPANLRVISN
jgi:hypothetical protein